MFEVGRDYRIYTVEPGENGPGEGYSVYHVVDWSSPLLKVKQPHGETIINVHSPIFSRAEKIMRDDEKTPFQVIIRGADANL